MWEMRFVSNPLSPEDLCRICDPSEYDFETTAELPDLEDFVGQERAVDALSHGIDIQREGYNVFVLGLAGTGRHSLVRQFLQTRAADGAVPDDWCYVNNFDEPNMPLALSLPAGRGRELRDAAARLVDELRAEIPAAFEGDDYSSRRQAIEDSFKETQEAALNDIQKRASDQHIALIRTPMGLGFAPDSDGQVMEPDVFRALPEAERKEIERRIQALQDELQTTMRDLPRRVREVRDQIRALDREVTTLAVGSLIDELRRRFDDLPDVTAYLDCLRTDVVEHAEIFHPGPEQQPQMPMPHMGSPDWVFRRYQINLFVDNGETRGAPVIWEDNPSHQNVIGRVEHLAEMGALVTDFNLIRSGALAKANGGYLVLEARRLLAQPYAYEALKQSLRARELKIESLGQAIGLVSTVSLEPTPIPLDLKVVLVGEPLHYYLLQRHDPEFSELFKVAADFDDRMDLAADGSDLFARLLATLARRESMRALDRGAVARVTEHASRLAGHSEKLTAEIRRIADVLREADHMAKQAKAVIIRAEDVEAAIEKRRYHGSRIKERLQDEVIDGTILIATEGARVGQVNGLSVLQLGDNAFGKPSRISARLRLGAGKLIDIEREVELGGPLHSKGVLILSGYLGARYAPDKPLSLSASLVFEQSYGGVDGDSASSAELYALLSALSDAPIKQCFAVTGSVNQYGEVQAIGGVNEKIEGFFDLCAARGLTGEQGVLIPQSNVRHLMLRNDVVEACRAGQFAVYPIATIDEGIARLTGLEAGERAESGTFPDGTINARVEGRLVELSEQRRAFGRQDKEGS